MNKHNFMGDGKTKSFNFTFPFFKKNDVVVEINSAPATGFGLFCTSAGLNADIPFSGGVVRFAKAPKATDIIKIYRKLELNRVVDYQPAAKISPLALNQDMNFMLEVLKDMQNRLSDFAGKYAEFTDKESTKVLLTKIDSVNGEIEKIMSEISAARSEIANLGDISSIQSSIISLNNSIGNLNTSLDTANTNITTLNNFRDGVHDYVIEMQMPTADNNYTWYRKYKSGWIEQGGRSTTDSGNAKQVILPIQMSDTYYNINILGQTSTDGYTNAQWQVMPIASVAYPKTPTSFYAQASITGYNLFFYWVVCGMSFTKS